MSSTSASHFRWLRSYYFGRAAFSVAWVAAAVLTAGNPLFPAVLLVLYPAWDAVANLVDARASGGLTANRSQTLNVVASTAMTVIVAIALTRDMHAVLAAFGVWAGLSGLFQLVTALGRRRTEGAQWAMILSGAQSVLAGGFMIHRSLGAMLPSIVDIAPYAAFGAFYFLVSALSLTVTGFRRARNAA